jgi:hypothetical protein
MKDEGENMRVCIPHPLPLIAYPSPLISHPLKADR